MVSKKDVLDVIEKNPGATTNEIANSLKTTNYRVNGIVSSLEAEGKIEGRKVGKNTKWIKVK